MQATALRLSLSFAAVLISCRRTSGGEDASLLVEPARVLILGTTQEPDSLDPVRAETAAARELLELLHRGVGAYDERWQFHPGLADGPPRVETSSVGTVLHFRLRPGHRWSDGTPLTAADFVHGHAVQTDPTLANRTLSAFRVIRRVSARSPLELAVELDEGARPEHVFSLLLALPRHVERKAGPRGTDLDRRPVSNGPFALDVWHSGDRIELSRREGWAGPRPDLDRIIFRFLDSEDAFEAALLTGRIDAVGEGAGLSVGKAARLAKRLEGTHVVERTESGVWLQVSIRHDHPLTKELAVRLSMSLALDRSALAEVVYEGEASPAGGLFPPRHPVGARPAAARDLAAARAALEGAGFVRQGEFYEKKGSRLELEMGFATGSEASERAASFIAASLAEVPIIVRLRGVPLRVLIDKLKDPARAPLAMLAWRLPPDWDAAAVVAKDGAKNYGAFHAPEIERAIAGAQTATTAAAWTRSLKEVDRLAAERVPVLSLVFRRSVSVRPKALTGWRPTGTVSPVTWNAEDWRWDRGSRPAAARRLDALRDAE